MKFNSILTLSVAAILLIIALVIGLPVLGNTSNWKAVEEPENMVVTPPGPEPGFNNTMVMNNNNSRSELSPGPKTRLEDDYNTSRSGLYPANREVVIVHFREMPAFPETYATEYGGKLIYLKEDINLAAYEMNFMTYTPQNLSQQTRDFIANASKDARVEEAYLDTFLFVDPNKEYTKEPAITYPADLEKQGIKPGEITNYVMVSFWEFPPSLEDFAQKHGGKLIPLHDANKKILYANFETDDIEGFLNNVSKDPYVKAAEPDTETMALC